VRLGKRSPPRGLFEADTLYADFVGRETFHGGRAGQRGEPFPAELFLPLSVGGWGRPSLPPSRLATALVLQTDEGVSDAEAAPRAASDLRGEGARGVAVDAKPFAQSTLREFRAPLLVHEPARALFRERLALAKRRGRRRRARRLKLARDTTPSFGRGAVKDTDNLLAAGIVRGRREREGRRGPRRGRRGGAGALPG